MNEDSAEAFEFFAAAASSGIEFDDSSRRSTRNRAGGPSSGMMTRQDTNRQRHFSLEDYNEMHCSGNEDSSNESFATAGAAAAGQAGMNSTKYSEADDEGLTQQQQQHHHMQIDDPEHISFNGKPNY